MEGYSWNFNSVLAYKGAILGGAAVTVELTFITIIIGTALGLLLCMARMSKNPLLSIPALAAGEIFRDLPVLVVLVWVFYALPAFGVKLSAFDTAVAGLSLNLAAFSSEIFRAGISSVPKGQREASLALGMGELDVMKEIILPQALRVVIPPLSGRYIETIKLTSLASVIAVNELLHAGGNIISLTYRPLEAYTAIALAYLAIIAPLVFLLGRLEGKPWGTH
jgi:polar amino acid transport system permease protein